VKSFTPDFLTAFSMTAIFAFTVAWVMWALGKKYWRQGLSWAIASTLLYGFSYTAYTLQILLELTQFQVISTLLTSAAIATFTIGLYRFNQNTEWKRDLTILILPLVISTFLVIFYLPTYLMQFNILQSAVTILQNLYILILLLRMRSKIKGSGWLLIICAVIIQLITTSSLIFTKTTTNLELPPQASTWDIVAIWTVCLMLFFKMMASSSGFVVMLRDRDVALEQGKARLDHLTQLPNRATLVSELEKIVQKSAQQGSTLSLMVIDIDHFKKINDVYGHLQGDQVIQHVAKILKLNCRSTDIAARYGGEEFVFILPNTKLSNAEIVANRIRKAVNQTSLILSNGSELKVTISVGVHSSIPTIDSRWEPLVDAADTAMYMAKQNGRNRVALSITSTV